MSVIAIQLYNFNSRHEKITLITILFYFRLKHQWCSTEERRSCQNTPGKSTSNSTFAISRVFSKASFRLGLIRFETLKNLNIIRPPSPSRHLISSLSGRRTFQGHESHQWTTPFASAIDVVVLDLEPELESRLNGNLCTEFEDYLCRIDHHQHTWIEVKTERKILDAIIAERKGKENKHLRWVKIQTERKNFNNGNKDTQKQHPLRIYALPWYCTQHKW